MGLFSSAMDYLAEKIGETIQGYQPTQRYRDYQRKGDSYSVEAEISDALAQLVMMLSTMPISGDSERARWLDSVADKFYQTKATKLLTSAYIGGDCLVIPSWNGRTIQNILVPTEDFVILETMGDEIISCAYVVDRLERGTSQYQLMQSITLEQYETTGEGTDFACHYRLYVAKGMKLWGNSLADFPQWADKYDTDWIIPAVDRLLIGRFKSFTVDPLDLNSVKGVPICFGASEPIEEIRYLLDQMHNEFGLSEKFVMASKRAFQKDRNGDLILPKGRDRLIMELKDAGGDVNIHDWSPDIRYNAYLEAIDKQEQLIERAVGVSNGIISTPNDANYMNVDNVRKSQQKTMAFVNNSRQVMQDCMNDLVYAWNVLANYYQITPLGDYAVSFDWSDEYIETFSDRQNAILAGEAIGATDAVDYRQLVFDESPEVARQRVEEIKAQRQTEAAGSIMSIAAV